MLFGLSFEDSRPLWDTFFCSSAEDLWDELLWASSRPESKAASTCPWTSFEEFAAALAAASKDKTIAAAISESFLEALTPVERGFLETYRGRNPGLCYSLNQNPDVTQTESSYNTLHTVIKNAGVIWSLGS